jgi:hypothetical protein
VLYPRASVINRQVCVKITTESLGYTNFASGYINVYVDSGDGYSLQTTSPPKKYNYDDVVLDKCYNYAGFKGLQVEGPDNDG